VSLMDLEATREFTESGLEHPEEAKKHAVIALHGRFKNALGERCHLMPLVRVTDSGLIPAKYGSGSSSKRTGVSKWIRNMRARQSKFGYSIWSRLVRVSEEKTELFPDKRIDIMSDSSTRRSFRRGATSRAEILGLSETVTNLNNTWRSVEKAKGKRIHYHSISEANIQAFVV
jgi:hypothetical protein